MFDLKFMYLKARLLVSFHTAGTFGFLFSVKPFLTILFHYIVIFRDLCQFSWFFFIASHCVCNVRVSSFFCSVFFGKGKSLYLCTLYIRIACLIYLKNKLVTNKQIWFCHQKFQSSWHHQ